MSLILLHRQTPGGCTVYCLTSKGEIVVYSGAGQQKGEDCKPKKGNGSEWGPILRPGCGATNATNGALIEIDEGEGSPRLEVS